MYKFDLDFQFHPMSYWLPFYEYQIFDKKYYFLDRTFNTITCAPCFSPLWIFTRSNGLTYMEFRIPLLSPSDKTNPDLIRSTCLDFLCKLQKSEEYEPPEKLSIFIRKNGNYDENDNIDGTQIDKSYNCFIQEYFVMGEKWLDKLKRRLRNQEDLLIDHLEKHSTHAIVEINLIEKKRKILK